MRRVSPWRVADRASLIEREGVTPRLFSPEDLVHVRLFRPGRRRFPREMLLRPTIPRNAMPGEDARIPRVSLAPSVGAALAALRVDRLLDPHRPPTGPAGVWTNVEPGRGWLPPWDLVPDAEASGEVWSLVPVKVELVGVLPPAELSRLGAVAYNEVLELREGWSEEEWDRGTDSDEVATEEVAAVRAALEWELRWRWRELDCPEEAW